MTESGPAITEMEGGDFLVIGTLQNRGRHTLAAEHDLHISEGQDLVIVPRQVMLSAIYAHARRMADE